MTKKTEDGQSRRDFLKLGAMAAPAAAASVVATEASAVEPADAAGEGLRKTLHVQAYLASARF